MVSSQSFMLLDHVPRLPLQQAKCPSGSPKYPGSKVVLVALVLGVRSRTDLDLPPWGNAINHLTE